MLWARSVAVVGASADPTKFGNVLLKSLIDGGFAGDIYPVNPRADTIHGLRCYASVADIPNDLDLAVIVVPAPAVPAVIEQAADKGAAGVFLLSGGFKESGKPELERALVAAVRERGMRMFGPNTQGIAYAPNNLSAVFWPVIKVPGPLAIVGQSGTVVAAITDWALAEGLGASASVSLGNQADLCESDVLRYLEGDALTRSVALYLEGVNDGARFVQTLRDVGASLPTVILKCGRSPRGREAVASHTGSLAGSDEVFAGMGR
jgi:acyl-CoA synthetase (NDP forming)